MSENGLFAVPPGQLVQVRTLSHAAVQWPSRAARANLAPAEDDGHSNLGWSESIGGLVSHFLDGARRYQLGFTFSTGSLAWLVDSELADTLKLEGADEPTAKAWCDARLSAVGLETTDRAEMPYDLDPVDYAGFAGSASADALRTLGAWYSRADVLLGDLVGEFGRIAAVRPTVRCWPHHYDLAALFLLDEGDPETVRSIGVGLSPGDESYAEPYFYCSPWPVPEMLPEAPGPLSWHTEGFCSLVCPASRIDRRTDLAMMLRSAVALSHAMLS